MRDDDCEFGLLYVEPRDFPSLEPKIDDGLWSKPFKPVLL